MLCWQSPGLAVTIFRPRPVIRGQGDLRPDQASQGSGQVGKSMRKRKVTRRGGSGVSHHLLMRVLGVLGNKEAQCSAIDAIKLGVAPFRPQDEMSPLSCWAWNEGASMEVWGTKADASHELEKWRGNAGLEKRRALK